MDTIEVVFEGEDLTITSETLKALGLERGDRVQVRTVKRSPNKPVLEPASFSEEEKVRRLEAIRGLWGLWSEEDEASYRKMREEMWSTWATHS